MKYVFLFKLKRNIRFGLILSLSLMVGFIVSMTVFFKVDSVQVSGDTRYSESEIIKSSGIGMGENLFLCHEDKINDKIRKKLPYVASVSVKHYFPNKILLTLSEAKGCAYAPYENGFVLLDKDGKVLDILDTKPENIAQLVGAKVKNVEPGETIVFADDSNIILSKIFTGMDKYLNDLTEINLADSHKLSVLFQNRIKVLFGSPVGLEYKIKTAVSILSEKSPKDASGVLDVSLVNENGKSYFEQKK